MTKPKCHRCAWHEHLRDHCELDPNYPNGCASFKSKPPTIGQGLLCIVICLALQVLLWLLELCA